MFLQLNNIELYSLKIPILRSVGLLQNHLHLYILTYQIQSANKLSMTSQ